jgi:hypothetical protein
MARKEKEREREGGGREINFIEEENVNHSA